MAFLITFNARSVEPNVAPEPVPTGTYPVVIVETGEKAVTGSDSKFYWELVMEIISGEFKGRKIYERLNHKNDNPKTVEIAMATLSSICYVTGVMQIQQSSQELHGKPFQVKVTKNEREDKKGEYSNNIRGYLDALGYEPGKRPADAANTTAGGAWGGATEQTKAADPAPQNWGGGTGTAEVTKTIEHQPAASQTVAQPAAAAQMTQAVDPRLVQLLAAGIDPATAAAAIAAQDAAAAQAAPAQTEQRMTGAPTAEDIAAQAAAMVAGAGGGAPAGGVPDWAK